MVETGVALVAQQSRRRHPLTMGPIAPYRPSRLGGGDHAKASLARIRAIGGSTGGLPSHGTRWWHALGTPVGAVWLLLFVPFLTLAPQWTGALDWTWLGHPVAGERFLYVPGFIVWSFAVWWLGRRTEAERRWCLIALACGALSLLAAPLSFERGSWGWAAYQAPLGVMQIAITTQLWLWAIFARIERPGVIILACCATAEFLIFVAVQIIGWDKGCVIGLGLTCLRGPFATLMSTMAGIVAMSFWCSWLARLGRD